MRNLKFPLRLLTVATVFSGMLSQPLFAQDPRATAQQSAGAARPDDLTALRDQIAAQQKQLEQLSRTLQ